MPTYANLAADIQAICNLSGTRFTAVPVTEKDGVILEFALSGMVPAVRFDTLYNKTSWDAFHLHGIVIDFRSNKLCVRFLRDADRPAFVPIIDATKLDICLDDINANDEKSIMDTVRQGLHASADGIIPSVDVEEKATEYVVYISGLKRITHYALANCGMSWSYDCDNRELQCVVPKRNGRKRARV